ncbi:telomere repeats-binding bouquet formation protein 2 isoform X2 [Rhinoderma darwinii]|uniref:telomere repeats-binding bouquet formation protein 2 isoform X2 n=1 Tax=Rhinoderma darwinii TaxID=43563 RepID=UPI003F6661B5
MYRGLRGWFSQSVDSNLINIWESEGGVITTSSHQADYLFSSDASHRDTQSFLRSHNRLRDKTLVTLGHFILPPPSLHEEIRRDIGYFIWEQKPSLIHQHVNIPCENEEEEPMNFECDKRYTTDSEHSEDVLLHTLHQYPVNNMFSGYTSIDQLKKFSEELHDFTPDSSEYCVLYVQGESGNFPGVKNVHNKK